MKKHLTTRFFSLFSTPSGVSRRRSVHKRIRYQQRAASVEQLEDKTLLVVGAFAVPPPVAAGTGFDGVVDLNVGGRCTGNLLAGGRHILTAAHCVTDGAGVVDVTDVDVTFDMPAGAITFDTNLAAMQVHPLWTGATSSVGDLAILELEAVAPFGAEEYGLYTATDELGQTFTLVGYGRSGTGATGQTVASGTKRLAMNEVGMILGGGLQLRADFDDGVTDTLGDGFGLGAAEGDQASGDSGGSSMLVGNLIMGIASFSSDVSGEGDPSTFGDFATTTRVSQFVGYISGIRDAAAPLEIDMSLQEEGDDGTADELTLERDAGDLVISIDGVEVHRMPYSQVTEINVTGSGDGDTLVIGSVFDIPIDFDGSSSTSDTLTVDAAGADVVVTSTSLDVAGASVVTFSNVEQLDIQNAGHVEVEGDASGNTLGIGLNGSSTMVTAILDGLTIDVSTPSVDFTFNGLGGSDTLTVDHSLGIVAGSIAYAGDGGFDSLVIEGNGGAVARETYLVGATQDAGLWVLDPDGSAGIGAAGVMNGDEMVVNFTGLDPVDTSTPVANFDIFLTNGFDNVRFENGGALAGFQSVRVVDVAGTFETFRYANKQNVSLDALGDDDQVSSYDSTVGSGELSRTLIGNDGNDLFQLGDVNTNAVGGMGNDTYAFVSDISAATVVIEEHVGEGSDVVTFTSLANPAQSADQSGVSLATAGAVIVDVAAAGQQQNIEFGVNALPYLNYTIAPPVGVPFMTMDFELEYADVGTMSTHAASFDWGDGNSDPGTITGALGAGVVNGSHQFDAVDTFNVIATITDDEALSTTDLAVTDIMQFALLPDPKMPGFTALFVGGTVGIDILEFRQQAPDTVRATLNGVKLGDFVFDGGVFAFTGSGNDIIAPRTTVTRNLTFEGGGDVDILKGSVGDDMLFGQGGKDIIYGRAGNDMIEGGDERDHIWGEDGDDTITGGEGNDVVRAGKGNDVVDGGSGNDKLKGEAGNDLLLGRGNKDTLSGGNGDDVMFGGSGQDKLNGGKGNDLLLGDASTLDADPVATFSIYDEWVNSAAAIPGRITNIEIGGGLNGANILSSGVTIFDDGKADVLNGGKGSDWFLAFAVDKVKGLSALDFLSSL